MFNMNSDNLQEPHRPHSAPDPRFGRGNANQHIYHNQQHRAASSSSSPPRPLLYNLSPRSQQFFRPHHHQPQQQQQQQQQQHGASFFNNNNSISGSASASAAAGGEGGEPSSPTRTVHRIYSHGPASERWPSESVVLPIHANPKHLEIKEPLQPFKVGDMQSWDFDAFIWAERVGCEMTLFELLAMNIANDWEIFLGQKHGVVNKNIFLKLIRKLGPLYRGAEVAPYHTILQAIDRTQSLYYLLQQSSASSFSLLDCMDGVERASLLISSLAADVCSPGRNNQFLVRIRDPVAVQANNLHVLENLALATLFSIVQHKDYDVTNDMDNSQLASFHQMCCSFILLVVVVV